MKADFDIIVIGLMSGTSLDGLDIACVRFKFSSNQWKFDLIKGETIQYHENWINRLKNSVRLTESDLLKLHYELGVYFGNETLNFIKSNNLKVDLIASHGHTVFHQPENNLTIQIGDANQITKITGIDTVCDFRSSDVAINGQGAPLVPIGDQLLFYDYDYCLNLGGIANISFDENESRVAYDICTCNMLLNYIAQKDRMRYDHNGTLAKQGNLINELLTDLNNLPYFKTPYPKSIGFEWFLKYQKPLIDSYSNQISDLMHTSVVHIVNQVKHVVQSNSGKKILITGGGTHNHFLIKKLKLALEVEVVIPDKEIIDYKEAIVFGLLGVLRKINEINVLSSVTGSSHNHSAGIIYWAPNL